MSDTSPLNASVPSSTPEELEIHTIPDKYYGAALKAQVIEKEKTTAGAEEPKKSRSLPVIIVAGVLLIVIGAGFIYFNRDLLFPPAPQEQPVVIVTPPKPPEPPPVPSAPSNATATSSNPQNVIVSWTDTSTNESGFRVERNEGNGTFSSLTSLPPNSTSFLDASVQPKKTYIYRIRALNVTGESDSSNEASATTPDVPPPPPEQPKLPPAGLDTDSDGLTDLEENLYGTEARNPDADSDGFLDGNEVFHLYNPNGQAPARLLDLALIKTVESRVGWVISIPSPWAMSFNVADGTKATIDSKHSEVFIITVEENASQKPIVEWYLDTHPGVTANQILPYRSKGGYTGIIGADLLTTYIPWGDKVFVFTYDLKAQPFINYRTTYAMMLNSLVLSGLPQTSLPTPGAPLPFEPSATSGSLAFPVATTEATSTSP